MTVSTKRKTPVKNNNMKFLKQEEIDLFKKFKQKQCD